MQFWSRRQARLQEEIQYHIALEIEENVQSGMSAEEARDAAQKKFGNPRLAVERSREVWGALWLEYILQDLRYAFRSLRRAPGYAIAVVLTLTLGLGAVATILAVMDSVLLRPVPLPNAKQLVVIYGKGKRAGIRQDLSYRQIKMLGRGSESFSDVAAYATSVKAVGTPDGARLAEYVHITPGFFRVLGVPAKMGRLLNRADVTRPVVLISDEFWQVRLNGDPHVLGSTVKISGTACTIVGILPRGPDLPFFNGGPVVYAPMSLNTNEKGFFTGGALVLARLKPGVSTSQALAEARSLAIHHHDSDGVDSQQLRIESLTHFLTGDIQDPLLALFGGVCILLLIACANAANLQIARATERLAEMQVRSALGASFPRLLQQLIVESLVVSIAGAATGGILAAAAAAALRSAYAQRFPRFNEISVHPSVVAAMFLLAVATGLLASLAPAFNIRRRTVAAATQRTTTPRNRVSGLLVVLQIALTCILLVACGLFVRTLRALQHVPLGFDPHHVTTLVLVPQDSHQPPAMLREKNTLLLERLQALPGVEAAAMQTSIPFSNYALSLSGTTDVSGRPFQKGDSAYYTVVSSSFVRASGIHLLQGRGFLPQDNSRAAMVVLVNQAFVSKFLAGRKPLGVSLHMHRGREDKGSETLLAKPMTIVGVVQNELQGALGSSFEPMIYLDDLQIPIDSALLGIYGAASEFAIRSPLPQDVLDKEIRGTLKQVAPDMAEMQLQPMEKGIASSLAERCLALRLVSSFGGMALLLAAIGIYGLLAYAVTLRRREIGIRMALGSSRTGAARLVLQQAGRMVLWGVIPGIAGAWAAGHAVQSFLFGVKALDPPAIGASAAVLAATAALAAAIPAWRAVQVDPMEVLREE
jgi:putative ABC transport system permease protein